MARTGEVCLEETIALPGNSTIQLTRLVYTQRCINRVLARVEIIENVAKYVSLSVFMVLCKSASDRRAPIPATATMVQSVQRGGGVVWKTSTDSVKRRSTGRETGETCVDIAPQKVSTSKE